MLSLLLLALINASVFSVNGLGEDMSVFQAPFINTSKLTHIEFTMRPEFNILNRDNEFRGLFWTNPFHFNIRVPVVKGFLFNLGNCERYAQSFDIYLERSNLQIHLEGAGGVEEAYLGVGYHFDSGEFVVRTSYLFGRASEIWHYYISDYSIADTFLYKYSGRIFSAGLKIKALSFVYETAGKLSLEKSSQDTSFDLSQRLQIGLAPWFNQETGLGIIYEYAFWPGDADYSSAHRFKLRFSKAHWNLTYWFNPWYLESVTEHGLGLGLKLPIKRVGMVQLSLNSALRTKRGLREIKVIPEIKLIIRELFIKRQK